MDAQKDLYREEAYELLGALEGALLELEERPGDMEVVGRVFRSMHTIKGSGAMFGFDDIASFTHSIETVYDTVREGKLKVKEELISLTLRACDQVKAMLDASRNGESMDEARTKELAEAFKGYLTWEEESAPSTEPAPAEPSRETGCLKTYRIKFKPKPQIFSNGTNPVLLLRELKGLGECSLACIMEDLPEFKDIDPERCYTSWDVILTTTSEENTIRDIFIFVEDLCELTIKPIDFISGDAPLNEEDAGYKKVGEILVERGDIREEDLKKALESQKRIGEVLVAIGAVGQSKVKTALVEQEHVRNVRKKQLSTDETSSIRVPSLKLDSLVNLVGELVTVQARLTEFSTRNSDPDLVSIAEEVEHLSAELRDMAMGIRMLPIGTIFAKFKRLVRDLSAELGKDISFITNGEETELDKTVMDKLSDPLVHLIRNSIDHGIETPEVRKETGKNPQGMIKLSAEHSGAYVLISVQDDGGGLDTQAIRKKAIEKGLISTDANLSEKEIFGLILVPGFSTAKNVSSVSGRGVGMDVVKSSIESFGGTIEIESNRGKGTIITLKLPLTLAIIDSLLVNISSEPFVIPLGAVVECMELTEKDITHSPGRHLIRVREEFVPYIHLKEFFQMEGSRPEIEQVVITDLGGRRVGFVVDKVVGQHQAVIKNLGSMYKSIEGISGATILGNGSLALILDAQKLIHKVELDETVYCGAST